MNGNLIFIEAELRYRADRSRRDIAKVKRSRRHPYIVNAAETVESARPTNS